jgi:hypothetical protein
LVIAVLLGGILLTDSVGSFLAKDRDGSVSGNSVSGNRVVNTLGFPESYAVILNNDVKPDCIRYTTVDKGTWWFDEDFARGELLDAFDEARMDPTNWVYEGLFDNDPPTEEQSYRYKNPETGLSNYDYELERLAMQRCIEVAYAVTLAHMRPNGATDRQVYVSEDNKSKLFPIVNDVQEMNGGSSNGATAAQIVKEYMEEVTGSHRNIIICGKYCRIGIACIRNIEGTIFTCIEYSEQIPKRFIATYTNVYTEPVNGYRPMTIDIHPRRAMGDPSMTGFVEEKIPLMKKAADARPVLNVGESMPLSKIRMAFKSDVILDKFASDDVYGRAWVPDREGVLRYDKETDTITALQPPESLTRDANGYVTCFLEAPGASFSVKVYAPIEEEPWIIAPAPTPSPAPSPSIQGSTSWGKKQTQHVTVRKKSYTFRKKALKRSSKSFYTGATSEAGPISYKVVSCPKNGKKYIKFSRGSKITVRKGAKKGTYKIRLTAAETDFYKSASTVIKIKVK